MQEVSTASDRELWSRELYSLLGPELLQAYNEWQQVKQLPAHDRKATSLD